MSNIDEQFNKLLQTGEEIGKAMVENEENGTTLTDEQVKNITETLAKVNPSPDTKMYKEVRSEERVLKEGFSVMESPVVNPTNGMSVLATGLGGQSVIGNLDEDVNIDDIMNLDNIETDITKIDITQESLQKAVDTVYPGIKINEDDIISLLSLANRYHKGENFSYYQSMPENIKSSINMILGDVSADMGSYVKEGRNFVAKQLLDTIVEQSVMDTAARDMNIAVVNTVAELNDISKEGLTDFFKLQKEQFEVNYPAQADAYEKALEEGQIEEKDIEKIKKSISVYRGVANSFKEAYLYTDMMEAYRSGKIKVKSIQINKIKRTCDEFNYKYQKSVNAINDIKFIITTLDRHVDNSISIDTIKKFVCIFVNYTKSKKPDDVIDHTFMYYFVKNIISLDQYNHSSEIENEFYTELIGRLNAILKEIQC